MFETRLKADHVYLGYRVGNEVLCAVNDVTVSLRGGQLTLMNGPGGSGKTSLLLLLGCLLRPDSGEVFVNGEPVSELSESDRLLLRRKHIGFVSQTCRLLSTLTVLQNVSSALEIGGGPEVSSRVRAIEALSTVSLEAKAHLLPGDLSRSEKQLVAIARAFAQNPQILLADEATGPLRSGTGAQIAELLARFASDNRLVVLASREPYWATYAHRMIRMEGGRIESDEDLR